MRTPRPKAFLLTVLLVQPAQVACFQPSHQREYPTRIYGVSSSKTTTAAVDEASSLASKQTSLLSSPGKVQVLSQDPLIYLIPNLLSKEECQAYQKRVLDFQDTRPLKRSNPPQVSLQVSKLWPLPFLSLLAGLPPLLRLETSTTESHITLTLTQALQVMLPNVAIALAASFLLAFGIVLPALRKLSESSSRTSVAVALNLEADMEFVQPLVDRVSALVGHAWEKWEAPVVTRYEPGAIFARHGDASPTMGSEWADMGGQRVVTCICYLNSLDKGGETYFHKLGFGVSPQQGSALVFFPADSISRKADDRTIHESLPADEDKWIVQLFGRAERVPSPLGLPDAYGSLDDEERMM